MFSTHLVRLLPEAQNNISARQGGGGQPGQVVTIQYLRAIAAMGVLLCHAGGFRTGAAGVDVFFVISGFIMAHSSGRRAWRAGDFALHRAVRIVPLYWLVTGALAATALLLPALFRRLRPHAGQIITSLLFVPHLDRAGHAWPLLVQGWSLNLEALFYAVFALSLAVPRWRTGFLAVVLGALAVCSLVVPRTGAWARTWCNPMLLEFLAGIVVGRLWLAGKLAGKATAAVMIGAAVAAFAATSLLRANLASALPQQPEWERVLVWGVPSFLLVAGVLSLERRNRVRRSPALLLLGDASYSLYLVQGLVISLVAKLIGPGNLMVVVPAALAAALVLHVGIEKPVTARLRAWARMLDRA